MGTRGFFGWRPAGRKKAKGWYNHYDSYYTGIGQEFMKKFESHNLMELQSFFTDVIRLVKEGSTGGSGGGGDETYERHKIIWEAYWPTCTRITLYDGSRFIHEPLFCEYAYIYDFSSDTLEVYSSFKWTPTNPFSDDEDPVAEVHIGPRVPLKPRDAQMEVTKEQDPLGTFDKKNQYYLQFIGRFERTGDPETLLRMVQDRARDIHVAYQMER